MNIFTPTLGLLLAALLTSFVATAQDCNCVIDVHNNNIRRSPACDKPEEICSLQLVGLINDIYLYEFTNLQNIVIEVNGNVNPRFLGSALSNATTEFEYTKNSTINLKIMDDDRKSELARYESANSNKNNPNSLKAYNIRLAECTGNCTLWQPEVSTQSNVAMPITLTDWTTTAKPGYVQLQWHTAAERDNDHFRVSRSSDGRAFQEIGRVIGTGTTDSGTEYTFRDLSAGQGTSYYRLEQFDFDGTQTDLGVQTVAWGAAMAAALSVSPNPVMAGALLGIHLGSRETIDQAQLIGSDGRAIGSYPVTNGQLQLPTLMAGVYTLKVDGNISRFVVIP